ncbi:MAG: hypothetical protein WEF86_02830 [Gemmatimonadota bacterium]
MTMIKRALMAALTTLAAAPPLAAQAQGDAPFTLYGFMTQGVAAADSLPVMGIPTTGTTDYRTVAIQARYRVDSKSNVVLQMSHRRIGQSPLAALEPDFELDWAFYRRMVGPVTVSAGRVPLPHGFYNEVRDVGTLLPFFRAPMSFYPDGTESVDGVTATTRVDLGRWAVELNGFAGGTEWKGVVPMGEELVALETRSERSYGAETWLITPIVGVRAGVSYLSFKDNIDPDERAAVLTASAEIDRDRWMIRSEVAEVTLTGMEFHMGYAHGRFRITPQFHVMGQYEQTNSSMTIPFEAEWTEMKDAALGVAFAPSSKLVFKLEGHRVDGYAFDVPMNRAGPGTVSNYVILSMSVSF